MAKRLKLYAIFVTIRLLRFGVKVKRAYSRDCRDNFLTQRPLPDMCRLPETYFLCFNRTAPWHVSTRPSLSWSEREKCKKRLGACVPVREARILTILSRSVITTNNYAK